MTVSYKKDQSLGKYQKIIEEIYALPDDRLYSLWDLLTQQQRFTMRALKGIRKKDPEKIQINLLIAFSWLMAIANRLHIDLENEVWKRFPGQCSYCRQQPCACKNMKPLQRKKMKNNYTIRPKNLAEMQTTFQEIYPSTTRTLADAGVHLAEEMGELSEAVHNYLGQHKRSLFDEIKLEAADYVSCFFGVANSINLDVAAKLETMFYENCHVCHKAPCICSFSSVSKLTS